MARYTIIKNIDILKYMAMDDRVAMGAIIARMNQNKATAIQKDRDEKLAANLAVPELPPEPQMFVLDMMDKYARHAIEDYIDQVSTDDVNRHNPQVLESLKEAQQVRDKSLFYEAKLPT